MTNDGPVYRAVMWKDGQFKFPNGKKSASGLQYTQWLEVPPPASGEEFQLEPPEQAEGQLVISGWMPGGTFPREPCEVVADLWAGFSVSVRLRRVLWFDGDDFCMKCGGPKIDFKVIHWMALPPVESNVSKFCGRAVLENYWKRLYDYAVQCGLQTLTVYWTGPEE